MNKKITSSLISVLAGAALVSGSFMPLVAHADNPVPAITSISPASVPAGSADTAFTINGSGFMPTTFVRMDGTSKPTTYVSASQLTVLVPAADLAAGGTHSFVVINSSPGGGFSNAMTFAVVPNGTNPLPAISSISPTSVVAGSAALTLTVNGSNFTSGSMVRVNGSARPTTFVSSTQLTSTIPASDLSASGTFSVNVNTPTPGGGTSNTATFTVAAANPGNNPVPAVASISPALKVVGDSAFTLSVMGSNFVAGSVVRVNGFDRPTTYVSSTQLLATITAADLAAVGNSNVSVFNPAPAGGTSGSLVLTVLARTPGLPNTGFGPANASGMNALAVAAIGSIALGAAWFAMRKFAA